MIDLVKEIVRSVVEGRADRNSSVSIDRAGEPGVKELIQKAIEEGIHLKEILNEGLLAGMSVVGAKWKAGDLFIPEVIVSAQALKTGMDYLRPLIVKSGIKPLGKFIIGTVAGDLHDIGKNLVAMMLEGAGFEVIDLGISVPRERLVEVVKQEKPQILGMSCLLTSTMPEMRFVIEALSKESLQGDLKVMVGGAPVTQSFADQIGADGYAPDAIHVVDRAKELIALG